MEIIEHEFKLVIRELACQCGGTYELTSGSALPGLPHVCNSCGSFIYSTQGKFPKSLCEDEAGNQVELEI